MNRVQVLLQDTILIYKTHCNVKKLNLLFLKQCRIRGGNGAEVRAGGWYEGHGLLICVHGVFNILLLVVVYSIGRIYIPEVFCMEERSST